MAGGDTSQLNVEALEGDRPVHLSDLSLILKRFEDALSALHDRQREDRQTFKDELDEVVGEIKHLRRDTQDAGRFPTQVVLTALGLAAAAVLAIVVLKVEPVADDVVTERAQRVSADAAFVREFERNEALRLDRAAEIAEVETMARNTREWYGAWLAYVEEQATQHRSEQSAINLQVQRDLGRLEGRQQAIDEQLQQVDSFGSRRWNLERDP